MLAESASATRQIGKTAMRSIRIVHRQGAIYDVSVDDGAGSTTHEVTVWPSDVARYAADATPEELLQAKAAFERDHITLKARPRESGRQLAGLLELHARDMSTPGFDMERPAEELFAQWVDYMHDYRDCH